MRQGPGPSSTEEGPSLSYRTSPPLDDDALNTLFAASWPSHETCAFEPLLSRSLAYIAAFAPDERLVGFVNLAWDGGIHAFVLDTTVHPEYRRQGIGQALVERAAEAARERGIVWLHVDYEPHLHDFYAGCGFLPTLAGLRNLTLPCGD